MAEKKIRNIISNQSAVIIGSFIVLAVAVLVGALSGILTARPEKSVTVNIGNKKIQAEQVSAPADTYRGLSGRSSLCADCGMLFTFSDSAPRRFVMRNMEFPLDIIFISGGKIIKIYANLPPEGATPTINYPSDGPADRVLEVNAGVAAENNWAVGDSVSVGSDSISVGSDSVSTVNGRAN